jgi:hypothetical protein
MKVEKGMGKPEETYHGWAVGLLTISILIGTVGVWVNAGRFPKGVEKVVQASSRIPQPTGTQIKKDMDKLASMAAERQKRIDEQKTLFGGFGIIPPRNWEMKSQTEDSFEISRDQATIQGSTLKGNIPHEIVVKKTADMVKTLANRKKMEWVQPQEEMLEGKIWTYFAGTPEQGGDYYRVYVLTIPQTHHHQIIGVWKGGSKEEIKCVAAQIH